MFELSVAFKYLIPKRRQLSVSIIALLSLLVISLVVWLVIVFLSVTHGIERRWIETMVSLNAPVRLTPTEAYYNSYYYQVDALSDESGYAPKTIGEKLAAAVSDPYDPDVDAFLPARFPLPDLKASGELRDPVKEAFLAIDELGAEGRDFEGAMANLRLRLLRPNTKDPLETGGYTQSFLNQASYLSSYDGANKRLGKLLVPPTSEDLAHYLDLLSLSADNSRQESPDGDVMLSSAAFQTHLHTFFDQVEVSELRTPSGGWRVPQALYPKSGEVRGFAVGDIGWVRGVVLTKNGRGTPGKVVFGDGKMRFVTDAGDELPGRYPLFLPGGRPLEAQLDPSSIDRARDAAQLLFAVSFTVDGTSFAGTAPYRGLQLGDCTLCAKETPWVAAPRKTLPIDPDLGQGILLAKSFQEHEVRVGDRGYLSYYANTASSLQEQRIPVYVAGFYDPGLMPIGGRTILVNREVTADIRGIQTTEEGNGIHVWFDDVYQADVVKEALIASLAERGIDQYWKVESFRDYEFARPLLQQFQSDRRLFSMIALIIIVVACSNIISMLILLVNDKRREIGVLRAMGAKGGSIAVIFGVCGMVMGVLGSTVGLVAAFFTLRHLNSIISMLSALQGQEVFQAAFYGDMLPTELSWSVLAFVAGTTVVISVIAGVIPAVKATLVRPATILRAE